jgi:hypothetical protein
VIDAAAKVAGFTVDEDPVATTVTILALSR